MPTRHEGEVVLARWTVDPASLRAFVERVRARYGDSPFRPRDLLDACDDRAGRGLEVVCRDDAVFVGTWGLAFDYNVVSQIRLGNDWILFEMEWGAYDIPVPLPAVGREEAERIVSYYKRTGEEETRRYLEARQAPTLSNRLLDIAEHHFAWVLLGLFFVVVPLAVLLVGLVRGSLR